MSNMEAATVYEQVGGQEFFARLCQRFYDQVADDKLLRPMYPEAEAEFREAADHLALFLAQFWGGPATYSETRGAPMLRARHMPFKITQAERDAWLSCMQAALLAEQAEGNLSAELLAEMLDYFDRAATHMINYPPPKFQFVEPSG